MKKILLGCLLLIVCNISYADNKVRIEELIKKQQEIVNQIQQAQVFISQKQSEALKIQGAVEELQNQDKK